MTSNKRQLISVLIALAVIALICFSCTNTNLLHSGRYRIKSLNGDTCTFYNVRGRYTIPSKGLKKGQKVYLKRAYKPEQANVIKIK